jgi:gamma-glutamyltranspeptidase/glutathione hydrolase
MPPMQQSLPNFAWESLGRYELLDFRETAPAASTEDMFANNVGASLFGGLASGIPGEIRGLQTLYTKYGSLPWPQLLAPAIEFARNGFTIGRDLATHIGRLGTDGPFLDPSWAIDFAPNGTILGFGDVLKRTRLADTLQVISDMGPDAFYSGHIAETMIQALKADNGIMTLEDLTSYKVTERRSLTIDYGDYRIHGSSAPFGGVVALNVMNVMKGYGGIGETSELNLTTHRLDEAIRFGYGLRTKLGDPNYDAELEEYQESMLSEATASDIRSRISDQHTQPLSAYNPEGLEIMNTYNKRSPWL